MENKDNQENIELSVNESADLVQDDGLNKIKNPFKLGLIRNAIHLKNKISIVPFIFAVVSMVVITFTIFAKVRAIGILTNVDVPGLEYGKYNGLTYFFSVLFSILAVVAYMNSTAKHASKPKKYIMLGIFAVMMIAQIVFDILYIQNAQGQMTNFAEQNGGKEMDVFDNAFNFFPIATSIFWTRTHYILVIITLVLAFAEPLLQPVFKKIQIK